MTNITNQVRTSKTLIEFIIFSALIFYIGSFFARESEELKVSTDISGDSVSEFTQLLEGRGIDTEFVNTLRSDRGASFLSSVPIPDAPAGRRNPFESTI